MAKQVQWRGGTTDEHADFTGAPKEVTVDTDKNTLVVHDGDTAGGHAIAKELQTKDTTTKYADASEDKNYKLYIDNGDIVLEEV